MKEPNFKVREGRSGTTLQRCAARLTSLLLLPVALPGWAIEYLVHFKQPGWQFSTFTSVPYFLILFALATIGVVYLPLSLAWIAFYPIAASFVLATWISVAIAMGRRGATYTLLREMGRRHNIPESPVLNNSSTFFGAACAYTFTSFSFGLWFFLVFRSQLESFNGLSPGSRLWLAWQFQYFSVITITSIGYGDIHPKSALAQAGVMFEAAGGIFYVVFLFSTIISHHVNRLTERQ